jgi:hypothetical protein
MATHHAPAPHDGRQAATRRAALARSAIAPYRQSAVVLPRFTILSRESNPYPHAPSSLEKRRPDAAATQKPDPVTATLRQFVPIRCFSERSAIRVGRVGVVASLVGSVAVLGGLFAAASVAAPVTVAAIGWWFLGSSSVMVATGYTLIEAGRSFRYCYFGTV